MGISWKSALAACIAALSLAACSGGNTGASPAPTSSTTASAAVVTPSDGPARPTVNLSPEVDSKADQTIVIGANTVSCNPKTGIKRLNVPGTTEGFQKNSVITVTVNQNETIIDWGSTGAHAIVVNKQNWAYAGANQVPMPAVTILLHTKWDRVSEVDMCYLGG